LVCFLDADDTVEEEFVSRMGPLAMRSVLGSSCAYRYVGPGGGSLCVVPPLGIDRLSRSGMLALDPPAIMSLVYKRSVIDKLVCNHGGPFAEGMRAYEDWDMLDRLVEKEGDQHELFGGCGDVLVNYWCTPNSLSSSLDLVWTHGCEMIRSRCRANEEAIAYLRAWGVGVAGGCIVAGDQITLDRVQCEIGRLAIGDAPVLVQTMRWHAMRCFSIPLDKVDTMRARIFESCEQALDNPKLVKEIKAGFDQLGDQGVEQLLIQAAELVGNDCGRVIIYGLGRNGVRFVDKAAKLGISVSLVDDQLGRQSEDSRWVDADSIGQDDVVIVTPMNARSIIEKLSSCNPSKILMFY